MSIDSGEDGIPSFRIRIDKPNGESHIVHFLTGEKHCGCQGFMSHGKCRHVAFADTMYAACLSALPNALEVLNSAKGRMF